MFYLQSVIVDTNIGYDIADTWALNLLLLTNLFDTKLISVTSGDIDYQVSLVAKILKSLNKEHIPIARGISSINDKKIQPQKRWLDDFDLNDYKGKIYDSYDVAYEEVLSCNNDIIVVGLAPFTALSEIVSILKKYNIKVVTMSGSLKTRNNCNSNYNQEFSVYDDLSSAQKMFSSGLNITLLPFDICNKMVITGENYQNIRSATTEMSRIVCHNYDVWQADYQGTLNKVDNNISSTILYDLAPVLYLIFPQNFEVMKKNLLIDESGCLLSGGKYQFNLAQKVHKLNAMLKFASEQYCTNFSYSEDIKQLEIKGMYSLTYVLRKCNVLLSVVEYGWEAHGPNSSYGPAERDYYILHFITKGEGKFIVGDKKYNLKKGDCFLLPTKIPTYYEADNKNPYSYYWVGFDGIEAKELLEKSGFIINNNYVIHPKDYNSVFKIFSEFDITTTNNLAIPYQLIGKLYMLFSEIMSEPSDKGIQVSNYVELAINYMNLNYSKKISIELLSKIVGVDRTYFYRLFKEATKLSPKEYLSNLRIEKAKMLLCNSKMNIKEIAMSVGFNNYFAFEKLFKEKNGISPTTYRKKNT